jgi:hypothetical protein|tara:strand:- start:497 stop:817 length:321 start_codon:yes stop_codon:yes gene_type:complete
MPARNNIFVPKESWPKFSWFIIEFAIVMAVAVVIAWQTSPIFEDLVIMNGWDCEQVSHITECSIAEEATVSQEMLNWIFWGTVGAIFLIWYLLIRGIVLKKYVLQN